MATTINVYLTFDGNCEEAFNFYKSVFGGEFSYIGRLKDMPDEKVPEEYKERIMHISYPFTDQIILMGSDTFPPYSLSFIQGNNITLSIKPPTEEDAKKIFNELSAEGTIIMPLEKTFWAKLYGMFTDKFGINWMINYE